MEHFARRMDMGGSGVVVRDDFGMGIATVARHFLHAHSVLNMEAEACRVGILLGIHHGWTNIDIESDYVILVAALKNEEEDLSDIFTVKQIVLLIDLRTLLVIVPLIMFG
ncbi:hypothetical protein ACLB2K_059438 [Fragaria x ananassa]